MHYLYVILSKNRIMATLYDLKEPSTKHLKLWCIAFLGRVCSLLLYIAFDIYKWSNNVLPLYDIATMDVLWQQKRLFSTENTSYRGNTGSWSISKGLSCYLSCEIQMGLATELAH